MKPPRTSERPSRLLAALVLLLAAVAPAQDQPPAAAVQELVNGSVAIFYEKRRDLAADRTPEVIWCGTGTLVGDGRHLLTNRHVGSESAEDDYIRQIILGRTEMGYIYQLQFRTWSPEAHESRAAFASYPSLAVKMMRREAREADVMAFACTGAEAPGFQSMARLRDLRPGMELWTLGNRMCSGWSLTRGEVVAAWDSRDINRERWIDAEIDEILRTLPYSERYDRMLLASPFIGPGNSGGPVVDEDGRLVGIAFAGSGRFSLIIPIEDALAAVSLKGALTNTKRPAPRPPRRARTPTPTPDASAIHAPQPEEIEYVFELESEPEGE